MLSLLLLLACAGNGDNAVTAEPAPFRGYKVDICVHTIGQMPDDPLISVAQVGGTDLLSASWDEKIIPSGDNQDSIWCAKNVVLHAENDGQAVHVRVAATGRAYVIERVTVNYKALTDDGFTINNFPYTEAWVGCSAKCATIEAWHDPVRSDWWRFNIMGVTGSNGIPTAIVDLPARRDL